MTATPTSTGGYTQADVLAHADEALAEAAAAYLELSEPDWKMPGSTTTTRPDLNADRRATRTTRPEGANLDVIDYLIMAEAEVEELAAEVLGLLGAHADPPPGEWAGALAAAGPDTGEAFRILRAHLPTLPAELAAEVCAAAWRLANRANRLLGGTPPLLRNVDGRRNCPQCHRRSFIAHPMEPAVWVCSTRSCAHREALNPSPSNA